jgi:ParB family transcriptional regulator, chromosome partitioning protein
MSNEWYTPSKYIEAARSVMGSIDLDPASCSLANETVKATTYYTKEQDGLTLPWYGNVWLNPPFGRLHGKGGGKSFPMLFAERMACEYTHGNIQQGIIFLIGLSAYRHWFSRLWIYPVCFHRENIDFLRPDGKRSTYGFGSNFVYIGPYEDRFIDVFSQFGTIARAVRTGVLT